jgi:hypothetical protein
MSELVTMMMMMVMGYDMELCGLFQYLIVLNEYVRSAGVYHGSE